MHNEKIRDRARSRPRSAPRVDRTAPVCPDHLRIGIPGSISLTSWPLERTPVSLGSGLRTASGRNQDLVKSCHPLPFCATPEPRPQGPKTRLAPPTEFRTRSRRRSPESTGRHEFACETVVLGLIVTSCFRKDINRSSRASYFVTTSGATPRWCSPRSLVFPPGRPSPESY